MRRAGGTLTPELFYRLFRARNDLPRFQHDLLMQAEARGKIRSAIRVCEYTLKKRKAGNIARSLERLKGRTGGIRRKRRRSRAMAEKRLIITCMKNEAPFILEWVAYHRSIGFTDFLVFTNDCDDGTVELLDTLAKHDVLTRMRQPISGDSGRPEPAEGRAARCRGPGSGARGRLGHGVGCR